MKRELIKERKCNHRLILLLYTFLMMFALQSVAQNVTISPSSGRLIAGATYQGEVGFENGWSSLWRHDQLPLTLTVSDQGALSEGGQLKDPAGNISLWKTVDGGTGRYVVMGGSTVTTHMNIALPKGYRFTQYRIVLLDDVNGKRVNNMNIVKMGKQLYETHSDFNINNAWTQTDKMSGNDGTREYVIARTSKTETDMSNNLYFYFKNDAIGFYGASIKSIELYFTAEGAFSAEVKPGTPGEIMETGVNMVGSSFSTSKLDLGKIAPHTKAGSTYYSYNYSNVKELLAKNWLYQKEAVSGGKLPATAGSGMIQALKNGDGLYYAVGNNTYYIETPIETTTSDNVAIPLGYRITGAKIKYRYGEAAPASQVNYSELLGGFYITTQRYGTTYYLQEDGLRWALNRVQWYRDAAGHIYTGNHYLYVSGGYISTTTSFNNNSNFKFDIQDSRIVRNGYYLSSDNLSRGYFNRSITNAVSWKPAAESKVVNNPAFKPSPYTLKVYDRDGSTIKQEVLVGEGQEGEVVLTGLNNDAVKFEVNGLTADSKALLTFELTLEALNPFINKLDIVCHSFNNEGPTMTQQFVSSDFQVSGGAFNFYVPTEFIGTYNKCWFSFENLHSKYGDETYPGGSKHARYYFAKSPYYEQFGDGKQYQATGNETYTEKVSTKKCGNQPFKYSNIDELDPTNTSGSTTNLIEYPYSEARYLTQQDCEFYDVVEVTVNNRKKCYLFTGDETRWNIAPTTAMEHRYYAYYLMDISLQMKDYKGLCTLTKLYDKTCYSLDGKDVELPMYGCKFQAYENDPANLLPAGSAYLTVNMMKEALNKELVQKGIDIKQILYIDAVDLYSVHYSTVQDMVSFKNTLNPNCLFILPERTSYDDDNYVRKTSSGGYVACKNIVLTDRIPFYSPVDIVVPAENYATYSRQITVPRNGKVANATIILPFTLELENGVHTNRDGACSFTVNQMNASNCLSLEKDAEASASDYLGKAYFSPVINSRTQANVPYMVKVEKAPADSKISFIATQYGSDVKATRGSAMTADYKFVGETATGSIAGTNYSFTDYGSYSGKKLDKTGNIFYFSGNMYLNSKNLREHLPYVYVYPFRGYYEYKAADGGAKLMNGFDVAYGENTNTTGIDDMAEKADMTIVAGNGTLTFTTAIDRKVQVYAVNGRTVSRLSLNAGDTRTVAFPAGVYIVNGVKIIVK